MSPDPDLLTQVQVLAISPDGRRIAFRGRSGDTSQIYLRDLSRETAEPVAGTEGGDDAFFSPDGEWLGFVAGDKLKKVAVRGGTPITLAGAVPGPRLGLGRRRHDRLRSDRQLAALPHSGRRRRAASIDHARRRRPRAHAPLAGDPPRRKDGPLHGGHGGQAGRLRRSAHRRGLARDREETRRLPRSEPRALRACPAGSSSRATATCSRCRST